MDHLPTKSINNITSSKHDTIWKSGDQRTAAAAAAKEKKKKKKKIKNLVGKWSHKNPLKRHQIHTNYSFSFQNFNKNDLFENSSTN